MAERLAFIVTFTLMAAFVVGVSVLAARSGPGSALGQSVAASTRTDPAGMHGLRKLPAGTTPALRTKALNARLAAALLAALGTRRAQLSVGVTDPATGATALFRAASHYDAGGIAGADILAALLYQDHQAGRRLSHLDAGLAAEMIDNGSGAAAGRLWQAIGQSAGLAAGDRALRLRHTIPGPGSAWSMTRTTVADQLQLLADLATSHSALAPADRTYELGLMARVTAGARRWGVPAAATNRTHYAVADGYLPLHGRFMVGSIGVVECDGHGLLIVVLSQDWPSGRAGIAAVRAAAIAAARVMAAGA